MPHLKPPYDYRLNKPYLTSILEIRHENERIKTFIVDYNPINEPIKFKPGQFVMVWLPGNDEIPMSVSHIGPNNLIGLSIANVGETTNAIHQLNEGDNLGIRGPYGNWYELQSGIAIIVGGGIGMASVLPLIVDAVGHTNKGCSTSIKKVICIEGGKTESDLLFSDEISRIMNNDCALEICTDDGTCGFKGFTTDKLDLILKEEINNLKAENITPNITVYACGPEKMLHKVYQMCFSLKIPIQLSLERMMRCGFGICGLCALEPTGLLVCRDGPIFNSEILKDVTDFGRKARDFTGRPYDL